MEILISDEAGDPAEGTAWQDRLVDLMKWLGLPDAAQLSLTFVTDPAIAELNLQYRGKSDPTDVLSFPQATFEGLEAAIAELGLLAPGDTRPLPLGDIVVSMDTARRQAEQFGHSLDREVGFLIVHGLLHLLGEDHQTPEQELEMRCHQRRCLGHWGLVYEA